MNRKLILFIAIVGMVLVSGCGLNNVFKDNSVQRTLTKESLKEYKPIGALVFGTIDKGTDEYATGLMVMFKNSPDLYLGLKDREVVPFLADVSYDCDGINKFGVRYNETGSVLDQWVLDTYNFHLMSNAVTVYTNEQITIMKRILNNKVTAITNKEKSIKYVPQVYYLGRIHIKVQKQIIKDEYKIEITNMVDYDQKIFIENYPSLTNADFIFLDWTKEKY